MNAPRTKEPKLSITKQDLVNFMREHGGTIHRHLNGYWRGTSEPTDAGRSFGAATVHALFSRGVMRYTKHHQGRSGEFPVEARLV
jgi:hypothetical protein